MYDSWTMYVLSYDSWLLDSIYLEKETNDKRWTGTVTFLGLDKRFSSPGVSNQYHSPKYNFRFQISGVSS